MANRPSTCKGKRTDSNCTCDHINRQCQDDEENNNHKENNVCSPQCTNCKLLNRLYLLLEEIVLNQKGSKTTVNDSIKSNGTRKSLRNNYEEEELKNYNETRKSKINNIEEDFKNDKESRKSKINNIEDDFKNDKETRKSKINNIVEDEGNNSIGTRKTFKNSCIVEDDANNSIGTRKTFKNSCKVEDEAISIGTRKSLRNSYDVQEANNCNGTRKSRNSYEEEEPKNCNLTRKSRNSYEEEESKSYDESRKPLKNYIEESILKFMTDYNELNSNKLMFCDCKKPRKSKSPSPKCTKPPENQRSFNQNWQSVGKIKTQQDFGCQCKSSKHDTSTQDDLMGCGSIPKENIRLCDSRKEEIKNKKCECEHTVTKKEDTKKCEITKKEETKGCANAYITKKEEAKGCATYITKKEEAKECAAETYITKKEETKGCCCSDSAVNTEKKTSIQNLTCLLLNDPNFRETLKLMSCNNVVLLSNGCGCCNKCNTERTSVTTNTSEQTVSKTEKNDLEIIILEDEKNFDCCPRRASVTFKSLSDQEKEAIKNRQSPDSSRIDCTKTLIQDTCCIAPKQQEFVVASVATVSPKKGKKSKVSGKSKKKGKGKKVSNESMENEQKVNICCQTSIKNLPEEGCKNIPKPPPPPPPPVNQHKDVATCCNMEKCQTPKKEIPTKPMQNGCNCTDIKNFVSIITELCAKMNKPKTEEKECECHRPSPQNDCLEIQRLAEQIVGIHLKSNNYNNKNRMSGNDFRRSIMPKTTSSDCTLDNLMPQDHSECKCKASTKPSAKKDKRGRISVSPKRKKTNEVDNYTKWTQQMPQGMHGKCTCSNYECMEETEIGCLNYNESDNSNIPGNYQIETCPHLQQIVKDCLCDSKNCYCNNPQLNEMKTTAKLERLADDVINTITPCNCKCAESAALRRYTTKQVCFSSICPDNPRKISNLTAKGKLFDKDVSGNPCLLGNKSETNSYIRKIANTCKKNKTSHLKKVVPSSKKLKPFIMKPLIPIAETACPQINCINSLFPEIYKVLSKIKEIAKLEVLPQEIVEMVIDKILKREIKCALKQMDEGVVKVSTSGDDKQNILNILLDDPSDENMKSFKNNVLDIPPQDSKESFHETINITNPESKDPNPILVQINIDKEEKQKKLPKKTHFDEDDSLSSIYITENKLGSIKNLITQVKNNYDDISIDSSVEEKNPISININIAMDKEKRVNLQDSFMNTVEQIDKTSISSFSSSNENMTKPVTEMEITHKIQKSVDDKNKIQKLVDDLHKIQKSLDDKIPQLKDNLHKSNMNLQKTALSVLIETEDEMPSIDEFLARNEKMKVKKIKMKPT